MNPAVRDAALRWIADDPDPATRDELRRLLATAPAGGAAGDAAAEGLAERMAGRLRFGTAGLRGPVRAGPNGMNVAVVRQTSAGLASWLAAAGHGGATVVVGRDARHGSEAFAAAAAGVLAAAGFDVRVLPEPLPTPLLAYAVRALPAVAGVQITASHNPVGDNGYKVYLGGVDNPDAGAQLVGPADAEIEAAIAAAPAAVAIPTAASARPVDVLAAYLDRVTTLPRGAARRLRIALTPLHGVGGSVAVHALRRAGFDDVHVVPAQAAPDPDFPTVAFPNPEEPGATDALLALAAEVHADLAIALDPDADRCALGVPDPDTPAGWRMLTGDETGVLLGEHLLATMNDTARAEDPLVASTVVSSTMLRTVAAAHGARYAETLTGFKWITRAGPGLVYGYEEALGYCVDPGAVRDKDGISAAVLAADLAATRMAGGGALLGALDELAVAHGVHLTGAVTIRMTPAERSAALDRIARSSGPVEKPAPDVFVLRGDHQRAVIRPSGTEPKLKAYLEVVEPVPDPAGLAAARARATERLAALRAEVTAMIDAAG